MRISASVVFICLCVIPVSSATLRFLNREDAEKKIVLEDEFLTRLSPFDISSRMCVNRTVDRREFKQFLAGSVLDWSEKEKNLIKKIAGDKIAFIRDSLGVQLPDTIGFIKTTGKEEGDAAYTRGNTLLLPVALIASAERLEKTLPHELFHILSRTNRKLRLELYRLIGFREGTEVVIPETMRSIRITNPDGYENSYYIELETGTGKSLYVPYLTATIGIRDIEPGKPFFDYLDFSLFEVVKKNDRFSMKMKDGKTVTLDPQNIGAYIAMIGRNTQYIIHPDEILADNFELIVNGKKNLPSPELIEKMSAVFLQFKTFK